MSISNIDHVAVTTGDLARFIEYYDRVLGARVEQEYELGGQRSVVQLRVGKAMLNVHRAGHGHPLVAARPSPGAIDLCFRWQAPIADAVEIEHPAPWNFTSSTTSPSRRTNTVARSPHSGL